MLSWMTRHRRRHHLASYLHETPPMTPARTVEGLQELPARAPGCLARHGSYENSVATLAVKQENDACFEMST